MAIYQFNKHVFDHVDSEFKAYWLGFIYADAYHHEESNLLQISLSSKDKDHLEKFREFLESNHPIKSYCYNNCNSVRINIINKHLSDRLKELGVMQNKSFKIRFPSALDQQLYRHFIRGYYDGDGSLSFGIYQRGKYRKIQSNFSIESNIDFCHDLKKIFDPMLNINANLSQRHKNREQTSRSLKISGGSTCFKLLKWFYNDSSVYLDRKYDKFISLMKLLDERGIHREDYHDKRMD